VAIEVAEETSLVSVVVAHVDEPEPHEASRIE